MKNIYRHTVGLHGWEIDQYFYALNGIRHHDATREESRPIIVYKVELIAGLFCCLRFNEPKGSVAKSHQLLRSLNLTYSKGNML